MHDYIGPTMKRRSFTERKIKVRCEEEPISAGVYIGPTIRCRLRDVIGVIG